MNIEPIIIQKRDNGKDCAFGTICDKIDGSRLLAPQITSVSYKRSMIAVALTLSALSGALVGFLIALAIWGF